MSHRLEYQWTAFHVSAASLGMTDDRFLIAIEGGDNNVCDARTGKRSRSWNVGMIGEGEFMPPSCSAETAPANGQSCPSPESARRAGEC